MSAQNARSSQRFFFVDDKSSGREKRAHAMKHHIREKKSQQNHSLLLAWKGINNTSAQPQQLSMAPTGNNNKNTLPRNLTWTKKVSRKQDTDGDTGSAQNWDTKSSLPMVSENLDGFQLLIR
jgi:ribosomal protein L35